MPVRSVLTDVVGHTEMMSRLGDARGRAVLQVHERLTRDALARFGGREIKSLGDGFMASFGSVTHAVNCAIALQDDTAAQAQDHGERLAIRVGLSAGEPIEERDPDGRPDLFGAMVIMAARIAGAAAGGEILVPETVRGLCVGKGFDFKIRGEFKAKGFGEPIRLFEVFWRGKISTSALGQTRQTGEAGGRSAGCGIAEEPSGRSIRRLGPIPGEVGNEIIRRRLVLTRAALL